MDERQSVLEVYKKISKRIELLKEWEVDKQTAVNLISELNWVRAELENTNEVNPKN